MVSFRSVALALASALVVAADYYIDPSTVPSGTRNQWCTQELASCPLICLQTSSGAQVNTCNSTTLNYGCLCNDGLQPNISQYSLTIPYFMCTQYVTNCRNACGLDATCASNCTTNNPCGAQSPTLVNTSTATSTISATGTNGASATSSNQIYTGLGGSSSTSSSESAAVPALEFGSAYGLAVVAGSLFAGFAVML